MNSKSPQKSQSSLQPMQRFEPNEKSQTLNDSSLLSVLHKTTLKLTIGAHS